MVLVRFPDHALIYPDQTAALGWAVCLEFIKRDGTRIAQAYLTPEEARERAEWIRAVMADQPAKIRAQWTAQADKLDHVADVVDEIRRAAQGLELLRTAYSTLEGRRREPASVLRDLVDDLVVYIRRGVVRE